MKNLLQISEAELNKLIEYFKVGGGANISWS